MPHTSRRTPPASPRRSTRAREIAPDIGTTARLCGVPQADIARFFDLFQASARAVTGFSQGVNQSAQGTDKVNAIINCHLATGRIGRPGMGPFSLTGQPNAMGGREVGGLANQLAAHMGFVPDEIDRVRRFWNAPRMATREGRKAVDMFEAIERGEIKALWVMATNPAVSLPRAGAMRAALERLELFVVSENVLSNDTVNAGAHVLLPAAAWGEKHGTVTNSERCISRQRAFLPLPGEAKPDWWIVSAVAQRLGFADAFSFGSEADVFREHAALSGFENQGTRDFDIGGLAAISDDAYAALEPVQWPVRAGEPQGAPGEKRFFATGGFFTPDRKARFVPPQPPRLQEATSAAFPFRLNTGRVRDQWHTMTRTGQSPRLAAHLAEPFVEIHPQDAGRMGLADGGFAEVSTRHGACILRVTVTDNQRPGSLFVPIHWSAETASCARVGDLVSAHTDPYSGQPEAKATPAAIAPVDFALRGFARAQAALTLPPEPGGPKSRSRKGRNIGWPPTRARLSGTTSPTVRSHPMRGWPSGSMARSTARRPSWMAISTVASAWRRQMRRRRNGTSSAWRRQRPQRTADGAIPKPAAGGYIGESEPMVCACFQVGREAVREAVAGGGVTSVADIGRTLRAGTNCGSCLPELKRIIVDERIAHPL